jgi:hypothetical protein
MPATTTLDILKLPKKKITQLVREAEREGISPEQYVRKSVEARLAAAAHARTAEWHELTRPYREALGHLSEDELDGIVDRARRSPARPKKRLTKLKRRT